jgi:DNA-binding transcriptional LysR family regulator
MRLAEAGAGIEAAISTAGHEGTVKSATGTVRISVPEGFGTCILAPAVTAFVDERPGLQLEIVTNAGYLSPSTREVDIAITSQPPTSSRLVVERLADYEIGLFGARDYLAVKGMPVSAESLKSYDFVGFVEDLLYSEMVQFIDSFAPTMTYQMSSSSIRTQTIMAATGGGLGAFPLFLAREYPALVRVLPQMKLIRTLWMASHHELCEVARIRAVRHWLVALVEASAQRLRPEISAAATRPAKPKR